jgi:hypothetical protein
MAYSFDDVLHTKLRQGRLDPIQQAWNSVEG